MTSAATVGLITGAFTLGGISANQWLGYWFEGRRDDGRRTREAEDVAREERVTLRLVYGELMFASAAFSWAIDESPPPREAWPDWFKPRSDDWRTYRVELTRALDQQPSVWIEVNRAFTLIEADLANPNQGAGLQVTDVRRQGLRTALACVEGAIRAMQEAHPTVLPKVGVAAPAPSPPVSAPVQSET